MILEASAFGDTNFSGCFLRIDNSIWLTDPNNPTATEHELAVTQRVMREIGRIKRSTLQSEILRADSGLLLYMHSVGTASRLHFFGDSPKLELPVSRLAYEARVLTVQTAQTALPQMNVTGVLMTNIAT